MELNVLNKEGKETGKKVTLNDQIFGIEPSDHAIYLDVKQYMANQRQGTSKSKERGEITGQKGTGTARAGSIKSPIFRGGGTIFGPRPRNYGFKLNKKVKQLARKSALTYKANEKSIVVIEDLNFEAPKTKEMVALQSNLQIAEKKALFVLPTENNNIYLSSRNLHDVSVVT